MTALEDQAPVGRARHARVVPRTRLDDWQRRRPLRWALRLLFAVPYLIVAIVGAVSASGSRRARWSPPTCSCPSRT